MEEDSEVDRESSMAMMKINFYICCLGYKTLLFEYKLLY